MRPNRRSYAFSGFTLAELLLAGFLILMLVLALVLLGLSVVRGTQKGSDTSAAQVATEHILGEFVAEMSSSSGTATAFWSGSSFSRQGRYLMNRTDFAYQLDAQTITDSTGAALGASVSNNRVKQLQLKVTWWDSSQTSGSRQGYGKLEYAVTRLFAEGSFTP